MKKNTKLDNRFDRLILVLSVVYPLTAVPQLYKVYDRQSADDLSLLSWLLYFALEAFFLAYAVRKRIVPIIVQNTLWLLIYIGLIVGILLYG